MSNEEFQGLVLSRFDRLDAEMSGMKTDISGMKTDMSGMKTDMSDMKTEISGMKTDISGMKTDISDMKTKINEIDLKLSSVFDQTAMLTEFKTEVNAKLDRIIEDNRSIYEVLGEHDVAIRTLRRRPV